MREIKFRAWSTDTKEIIQNVHLARDFSTYLTSPTICLMQYTGLKDKNGVEIFEGDIVDTTITKATVVFGNYKIGSNDWEIDIETPCFCLKWPDGSGYSPLDADIEIIGNIYQDGHLLK